MSRIQHCFERLAEHNRKALIPYVTAGDPSLEVTAAILDAMVEAGADVIELGVPFSDPMADGPVIQKACERSLAAGTSLKKILALVADFRTRNSDTPIVLMGYLNPVEAMGYEAFAEGCKQSGVDGVLLVDMPPEETDGIKEHFTSRDIDLVFLLAPTTTEARMDAIAEAGSGYLYYVSLKGVTGSASLNVEEVASRVETIRKHTGLPIGVGFGIKDAESARAVSRVADGVVVGSALVNRIAENADKPGQIPEMVAEVLRDMRAAMDQG